jgi:hypothetical protein
MQHTNFKEKLVIASMFTAFFLTVFAFTARAGGDTYRIYLNDKLVLKEFVIHPISLKNLPINKARADDKVIIYYSHCGTIGKGRSIAIKDAKGNTLKEWKFANAAGADKGMTIPVRELLQLEKNNSNLTLYYAAEELPKGLMLASFNVGGKSTI